VDPRILLRIGFIALLIAFILLIAKMASMAFDSRTIGKRLERDLDRVSASNAPSASAIDAAMRTNTLQESVQR
jgi:hypothetical protein